MECQFKVEVEVEFSRFLQTLEVLTSLYFQYPCMWGGRFQCNLGTERWGFLCRSEVSLLSRMEFCGLQEDCFVVVLCHVTCYYHSILFGTLSLWILFVLFIWIPFIPIYPFTQLLSITELLKSLTIKCNALLTIKELFFALFSLQNGFNSISNTRLRIPKSINIRSQLSSLQPAAVY